MIKYTIFLGLNDKDKKIQLINTLEAVKICNNILFNYTDGVTISEATGFYKHKNGTITTEKSLKIELLFIEEETIQSIIKDLKKIFNQESVVLQKQNIESDLI